MEHLAARIDLLGLNRLWLKYNKKDIPMRSIKIHVNVQLTWNLKHKHLALFFIKSFSYTTQHQSVIKYLQ